MEIEQLLEGTVIAIDKPRQWTSFQVVNRVKMAIRHTYDIKRFKIGHAGTLDPLATGLLLVCVGKATKRINELQDGEKMYCGTFVLGATTPCYDLERPIDHFYHYEHITQQQVEAQAKLMVGTVEQVPPIFSAVKIGGQRAYTYAREVTRRDTVPEPTPKKVTVKSIEITQFRPGNPMHSASAMVDTAEEATRQGHLYRNPLGSVPDYLPQADFRICCGKGTYIRSIARDLGLALDSGAFLSALRREQVGEYSLSDAIQLDDIQHFLAQ